MSDRTGNVNQLMLDEYIRRNLGIPTVGTEQDAYLRRLQADRFSRAETHQDKEGAHDRNREVSVVGKWRDSLSEENTSLRKCLNLALEKCDLNTANIVMAVMANCDHKLHQFITGRILGDVNTQVPGSRTAPEKTTGGPSTTDSPIPLRDLDLANTDDKRHSPTISQKDGKTSKTRSSSPKRSTQTPRPSPAMSPIRRYLDRTLTSSLTMGSPMESPSYGREFSEIKTNDLDMDSRSARTFRGARSQSHQSRQESPYSQTYGSNRLATRDGTHSYGKDFSSLRVSDIDSGVSQYRRARTPSPRLNFSGVTLKGKSQSCGCQQKSTGKGKSRNNSKTPTRQYHNQAPPRSSVPLVQESNATMNVQSGPSELILAGSFRDNQDTIQHQATTCQRHASVADSIIDNSIPCHSSIATSGVDNSTFGHDSLWSSEFDRTEGTASHSTNNGYHDNHYMGHRYEQMIGRPQATSTPLASPVIRPDNQSQSRTTWRDSSQTHGSHVNQQGLHDSAAGSMDIRSAIMSPRYVYTGRHQDTSANNGHTTTASNSTSSTYRQFDSRSLTPADSVHQLLHKDQLKGQHGMSETFLAGQCSCKANPSCQSVASIPVKQLFPDARYECENSIVLSTEAQQPLDVIRQYRQSNKSPMSSSQFSATSPLVCANCSTPTAIQPEEQLSNCSTSTVIENKPVGKMLNHTTTFSPILGAQCSQSTSSTSQLSSSQLTQYSYCTNSYNTDVRPVGLSALNGSVISKASNSTKVLPSSNRTHAGTLNASLAQSQHGNPRSSNGNRQLQDQSVSTVCSHCSLAMVPESLEDALHLDNINKQEIDAASKDDIVGKNETAAQKETEQTLATDDKLAYVIGITGRGAIETAQQIFYRPIDQLTHYRPALTVEMALNLVMAKPVNRLIGEIAFQLDRRILEHVFARVGTGETAKRRSRYYGFSVANISSLIRKEARKHGENKIQIEELLFKRLDTMLKMLGRCAYDIDTHGQFTQDMVNKYGLLNGAPLNTTPEAAYLNDVGALRLLIGQTLSQDMDELFNMLIILDCLCLINNDEQRPLVSL